MLDRLFFKRYVTQHPFNYWFKRFVDLPVLLKWARIPKKSSILEIGCGDGRLSAHLAERLKPKNLTAVDEEPRKIAQAEHRADKNPHVIFQVAHVLSLDFPDSSFDVVLSMNALHPLAQWQKAIREIRRVLKPGGKLLLRDLSIETFTIPGIGLLLRTFLNHPYDHMFDQKEFCSYLRRNGFEITHQVDSSLMLILVAVLTRKPSVDF